MGVLMSSHTPELPTSASPTTSDLKVLVTSYPLVLLRLLCSHPRHTLVSLVTLAAPGGLVPLENYGFTHEAKAAYYDNV